ncbi:MAG: dTMP kinase [Actinomycetota bacterium]
MTESASYAASDAVFYIAFEGGEGCGKSTQAAIVADRLDAVLTREPGGTPLGAELRQLLLGSGDHSVSPRAEALMMAADRSQHLQEVILPSLAKGRHVVSDRSAYSSLAYQGGGRELGIENVRIVNDWAVYGRWPDVVVYLQVDRDVASGRLNRKLDRIEQEDEWFHKRVTEAFDALAADEPDRWLVVDGSQSVEAVTAEVWGGLRARLDLA